MALELTKTYVVSQSQVKLLELGVEVAEARNWNKPEIQAKIELGIRIRMWLKALQYSDYLETKAVNRLVYTLADLANVNAIPYAPLLTSVASPSYIIGERGRTGLTGPEGPEGGGVPFSETNVQTDKIVDSFDISLSPAADWSVVIYGPDGMRVQRIIGGWSDDGSEYDDDGGDGIIIYGDTSPVTISTVVTGTTAQLFATVTDGEWTIKGTRKFIPNNGSGVIEPSSLAEAKIWIGSSSNIPTAQAITGDVTVTAGGVTSIASGVIVNADINASAGIDLSKLASLTASRALVSNASGVITVSSVTDTQIGYLSNVTSDIQIQLDSKLDGSSGAISTVTSVDLTANRVVISNPLGKIATTNVTTTEVGYVSGVTSAIQTQIDGKQATITGAATTVTSSNLTASRAVTSNGSGKLDVSTVTTTELGYVSGVTSAIQTQLNGKISTSFSATPDLNSLTTAGIYIVQNATNRPVVDDNNAMVIVAGASNNDQGYQVYITLTSASAGEVYMRPWSGGFTGSWTLINS
jgi:hypothetical protein